MKRHLIWIIAGTAAIGLAVPAFATVGPGATPDDNGTPGEVRGNCDEAEHAGDPNCVTVNVPAPTAAVTPATAATTQVTVPSSTTPASVPSNTVPSNTAPANTVPDNTTVGTAPSNTVNSVPGDISGPCDEAEHANDPRCTGAAPSDDNSGRGGDDDDGDGDGDDSGRHSGGDDDSGHHGGGDDDNSGHGSDD